jgi:phage gp46-like protein
MIRLDYDNALAEADLGAAADGGIAEGDELLTAVLISLYTDAYADDGELRWMIDDGIATSVDVDVTRQASGRYAVFVSVVPTSGAKRTFDIEV